MALVAAELAGLPHETAYAPGNIIQNSAHPLHPAERPHDLPPAGGDALPAVLDPHAGADAEHLCQRGFLDELAAAAGVDPLDFRLKYLKDPRGMELLQRLAALAKWEKRPSPRRNQGGDVVRGRGPRYVKYELNRTYVARSPRSRSTAQRARSECARFFVVHDCGQIINPDGSRNQIEGNVVQTVSRTLKEELTFDRAMVTSLDWATYPILTFPEVPEVVIDLIDRPQEKPWGAGEPSAAVVPAAISNAVFDATGVRLRSVPYTPAKVKAALQGT